MKNVSLIVNTFKIFISFSFFYLVNVFCFLVVFWYVLYERYTFVFIYFCLWSLFLILTKMPAIMLWMSPHLIFSYLDSKTWYHGILLFISSSWLLITHSYFLSFWQHFPFRSVHFICLIFPFNFIYWILHWWLLFPKVIICI
jgi:hypothetical protein